MDMYRQSDFRALQVSARRAGIACDERILDQLIAFLNYTFEREEGADLPVHPMLDELLEHAFSNQATSPAVLARKNGKDLHLRIKEEHGVTMIRPGTLFYMTMNGTATAQHLGLDPNTAFERPGKILAYHILTTES